MQKVTLLLQAKKLGYTSETEMFKDLYVKKFYSQRDLKDKLNTTRDVIRARMKELGIQPRPKSFAKRTGA